MDSTIECPKHNGQFNYKTGAATRLPACDSLRTYPVRAIDGRVKIQLSE
jgi:3-phenylpropionate/trans-cinnamate dioxygenase ferredoxin subunit